MNDLMAVAGLLVVADSKKIFLDEPLFIGISRALFSIRYDR